MKKFLVIYGSTVSAREQMAKASPAEAKAGMEAWMAWSQKAGKAIVDLGAPVGNSAKVAGGTATDSKSEIGGFSILQAESRDALTALLKEHPHFKMPGATIEVHEFLPLPGM
ncbi:MAG TPA: YciI family protein [Kofleriaceae bacterium]|nr:YciI family protein [Kofleriaceae bacterium]